MQLFIQQFFPSGFFERGKQSIVSEVRAAGRGAGAAIVIVIGWTVECSFKVVPVFKLTVTSFRLAHSAVRTRCII